MHPRDMQSIKTFLHIFVASTLVTGVLLILFGYSRFILLGFVLTVGILGLFLYALLTSRNSSRKRRLALPPSLLCGIDALDRRDARGFLLSLESRFYLEGKASCIIFDCLVKDILYQDQTLRQSILTELAKGRG